MNNLFDEDWRDCLRAHFMHVIHERDGINEESLITVLRQTGFNEDEIVAMRSATLAALGIDETPPAEPEPATAPVEPIMLAEPPAPPPPVTASTEPVTASSEPPQPQPDSAVEPTSAVPAARSKPDQHDEPPEPDSLKQMSLF